MEDATISKEPLSNRASYEILICLSFVISLLQGSLQLAPSLEVNGVPIALTKLFIGPALSFALTLAVSRLRSRIAAVVFLITLGLSFWLVYLDLVEDYWANWPFAIGLVSVAVDCVAAALILRWFARSEF